MLAVAEKDMFQPHCFGAACFFGLYDLAGSGSEEESCNDEIDGMVEGVCNDSGGRSAGSFFREIAQEFWGDGLLPLGGLIKVVQSL